MKRSSALCSLILLLVCSMSDAAQDAKPTLTGAEIVNKHIEAAGGKAAFSKIKSRVALGTAKKDNDTAVPVAIMSEAPNRLSAVYQFQGYNWYLGYDGKKTFFRPVFSHSLALVMNKYEDMLASGTMFNSISLYNTLLEGESNAAKFEAKGMKKVKGRQAYVVEMKTAKGQPARLYFDTENFMWVRTDYGNVRVTKAMSGFTNDVVSKDEETTFDFYVETTEFKAVDGVKLPFKLEMVVTTPILKQKNVGTIVTNISEYRHNIDIDPKMFQ